MLFIDFEHLKIVKDFHFTTIEKELKFREKFRPEFKK